MVFGSQTTLSGQLTGADNVGETIDLFSDPFPFGSFSKTETTQTVAEGRFSFTESPSVNTLYRVDAKSKAPATSPVVRVRVAPLIALTVSDTSPSEGGEVRFSGTLAPAHDGLKVEIQRRDEDDGWVRVSRATLKDNGDESSRFRRTIEIAEEGPYRVILRRHDDHATGKSPVLSLDFEE